MRAGEILALRETRRNATRGQLRNVPVTSSHSRVYLRQFPTYVNFSDYEIYDVLEWEFIVFRGNSKTENLTKQPSSLTFRVCRAGLPGNRVGRMRNSNVYYIDPIEVSGQTADT